MRTCNCYPLFLAQLLLMLIQPVFMQPAQAQPANDGHLFDQGFAYTERSPRAPEALDKMKGLLGQWDVMITTHDAEGKTQTSKGSAEITYMNRGYAYMSRIHVPAYTENQELNLLQFLNFSPSNQSWVLGEANSYSEHISMYNGLLRGKKLVVSTAIRKGGAPTLTHLRVEYVMQSDDSFSVTRKQRLNDEKDWVITEKHVFSRRASSPDFMQTSSDPGTPNANRPPESSQFDFLIGEWQSMHKMNLSGQEIQIKEGALFSIQLPLID